MDIPQHLMYLNKKLQGKEFLAMDMCSIVTAFEAKLEVYAVVVAGKKTFFPYLTFHAISSFKRHVEVNEALADKFQRCFSDSKMLTPLQICLRSPHEGHWVNQA